MDERAMKEDGLVISRIIDDIESDIKGAGLLAEAINMKERLRHRIDQLDKIADRGRFGKNEPVPQYVLDSVKVLVELRAAMTASIVLVARLSNARDILIPARPERDAGPGMG